MKLPEAVFLQVVKSTPLISIDLIVRNPSGQVLLGLRKNRPAQGSWFVPGGRIFKDEYFVDAFARLAHAELGLTASLADAKFMGPYEHHYADNVSAENFTTHYVVLAYQLTLNAGVLQMAECEQFSDQFSGQLPKLQHTDYRWFDIDELLSSPQVHDNTKAYFHN